MKIYALLGHPGSDKEDIKTLVRDSKYCIVGEAWGYTRRQTGYYKVPLIPFVGCWTCVKFGRVVGKIAKRYGQLSAGSHSWNTGIKNILIKTRQKLKALTCKI